VNESAFSAAVIKLGSDALLVDLKGDLMAGAEGELTKAYDQASGMGVKHIIMVFTGIRRLNSPGASLLVKMCARAKHAGIRIIGVGVSDVYEPVFELTQLDVAMNIYDADTEAIKIAKSLEVSGQLGAEAKQLLSTASSGTSDAGPGQDASPWAKPVSKLHVPEMPPEATSLNVEGRRAVGPLWGFGPMWEKTYQIRLTGPDVTPTAAIKALKQKFPQFQPPENRFYPSVGGIQPGEIVLINSSTPGGPAYTGVVVSYADDECFTLMTPQGHPESGWVTFSAFIEDGHTVAQVQGLARAHDPIFEVAFRIAGSKFQEKIWKHVLTSLGKDLGSADPVQMRKTCIDTKMQWGQVGNLWYNSQVRSLVYTGLAPLRWVRDRFKK